MTVYYNELDPKAAAWLRALMAEGLIPKGEVDERSIVDVRGSDLAGFTQCHFFAGIAGWAEALRIAGWGDRPVWTGSCPCQPFSAAGKGEGVNDKRHLWPELRRLISGCAPPVCFGEQVASAAGRDWLAGVRTDLEALAYAVGAADLCAAGAGAPHIRQRLWWVADSQHPVGRPEHKEHPEAHGRDGSGGCCDSLRMGDSYQQGPQGRREHSGEHADQWPARPAGEFGWMGESDRPRRIAGGSAGTAPRHRGSSQPAGYWSDFDLVHCTDGKARRIEPGTFPLAHGVPARVGRLRGYGNAIVPAVAAEFIAAYMEAANG